MSSILTNNGAMVALQTMKQINRNMSQVQGQISTGLKVGNAKDNAATWAISKVMESDVAGFKTIQDSLSLGSSTVNVARNAAETTVKLLTEIKEKIVGAQEQNVDRGKIQTDIEQLTNQISSVVGAAQFNGLNLVNGSAENPLKIMSSLDRSASGGVTASDIEINLDDLNLGTKDTVEIGTSVAIADVVDEASLAAFTASMQGGDGALARTDATANVDDATGMLAGDNVSMIFNEGTANEVKITIKVAVGDTTESLGARMATAFSEAKATDTRLTDIEVEVANDGAVTFNNETGATTRMGVEVTRNDGGLGALEEMNVATADDATRAAYLTDIETMIQYAIDASSAFGSAQKRVDIQKEFVGSLMDSMKSGIGSLVDADMEETSARLQALQVQQQLGIQALSIANQQPQNILSLFR